jgi:hypothetical protein
VTGSGLSDYNGATVKYLSQFIPKSDDIKLRTKVINIGDWDMDASSSVNVNHGLTLANIRTLNVMVRNDAGTVFYPTETRTPAEGDSVYVALINATFVQLERQPGSDFDSTLFDSTSYNRGWVTIQYVE